jgi:HEAT repeat protein
VPQIAERLLGFTRHELPGVRWTACYHLGRMAQQHPELKPQITPAMIAAMTDENERNRSDAAARIGWMGLQEGAAGLLPFLADKSYKVRLAAAKSLWQITDNPEAIHSAAIEILAAADDDFEAKREAALALREVAPLPLDVILSLRGYAAYQGRPPFHNNGAELQRFQLAEAARAILKEHIDAERKEP